MMLGLTLTLVRGVVAPDWRDIFSEFTGHLLWVPYLSLASFLWFQSETRQDRAGLVRFARSTMWIAMAAGVADLVLLGWAGAPVSNITRASPWRFMFYWPLSVAWLAWLGSRGVSTWVAGGVQAPMNADNAGAPGGRTRG
jgi:hypothetical protein